MFYYLFDSTIHDTAGESGGLWWFSGGVMVIQTTRCTGSKYIINVELLDNNLKIKKFATDE